MLPDLDARTHHGPNGNGAGALHPSGRFRARPGVLTARALDAAALYDPRAQRYVTLNPVATRIWDLLEGGHSTSEITAQLCAEFAVPHDQVTQDVSVQLHQLLHDGLIEPRLANGAPAAPAPIRMPSVPHCALTIARIKWLLRTRRFEGTLAWLRVRTEQVPASDSHDPDVVKTMEYTVAMAGALYPGRAKCLEQSLTLYLLARRQGVAVRYCQGMQLYPFEAHAWIEYQGTVVNDVAEHIKYFTKFPDQLP